MGKVNWWVTAPRDDQGKLDEGKCACCGEECGCFWDPTWMTESDPDFMKKLLGTDPNVLPFTQVSISITLTIKENPNDPPITESDFHSGAWTGFFSPLPSKFDQTIIVSGNCLSLYLAEFYSNSGSFLFMGDCPYIPPDNPEGFCSERQAGPGLSITINGITVPTMVSICDLDEIEGIQSGNFDVIFTQ